MRLKILAFESSARAAGTALLSDGVLLGEYMQNSGQTHSRTLLNMAQELLAGCDLAPRDVDAVAVAAGPGSFTGVRIGVAAAKGFAWGLELPLCGVSTLEAMALGAACCDGIWCACMDARRSQLYTAVFESRAGALTRLSPDSAISLEELESQLKEVEKPVFLVGDGAQLCYNTLGTALPALRLLPEHLRQQRAAGVALLANRLILAGADCSAGALQPNYLRMSQAERVRREKERTEQNEEKRSQV